MVCSPKFNVKGKNYESNTDNRVQFDIIYMHTLSKQTICFQTFVYVNIYVKVYWKEIVE